jgi:cytoskeletal protein RodZ
MPEEPPRKRRLRAPSPRRFAAGALASFVAVFGVLALRLHDGQDPSLQSKAVVNQTNTTASQTSDDTSSSDDSTSSSTDSSSATSSDDSSGAVSSTPSASTSAS